MDIESILKLMIEVQGSDLLLKTGARPAIKVDGDVKCIGEEPLQDAFTRELFEKNANEHAKKRLREELEADVALEFPGLGRFRANAFFQRGKLSLVLRRIFTHVGSFADLTLPEKPLGALAASSRGLVLITGVAGSGKSTTLASMIEWINQNHQRHIITLEDPIEFIFEDKKSFIQQRELGLDTETYAGALKHIVRQSPDVIMLGEMRDVETMTAALGAAETGHLVFSTLHTIDAPQTVERIIGFFPPHQHELIHLQLSLLLRGVVSQRLVPRKDGKGRIPAVEVMSWTPTVRQMLEEGKTHELHKAIEGGSYYGMQTFNQSLVTWLNAGVVGMDDALLASDDPDGLKLEMRGIRKGV